MSLGRREASWVHLSGCWSSGKIHVCGGPASGAHLCDCWSPGKIHDCEGPASEVYLFCHWSSVRIWVWPEVERESEQYASRRGILPFFLYSGAEKC